MTRPTLDGSLTRIESHKADREATPIRTALAQSLKALAQQLESE